MFNETQREISEILQYFNNSEENTNSKTPLFSNIKSTLNNGI